MERIGEDTMFLTNYRVKKEKLQIQIVELELQRIGTETAQQLEKEIESLKTKHEEESKRLKHDRKIAEEDIKHMVRMKEERLDLQHDKKVLELERKKDAEIADVKDTYRDKLESRLEQEVAQTKQMYTEILERLPNVNVSLKGKV